MARTKGRSRKPLKTKKKGKRDLVDLYRSVVTNEKFKKKKKKQKSKEIIKSMTTEKDSLCSIEDTLKPVSKTDLSALLNLLNEEAQGQKDVNLSDVENEEKDAVMFHEDIKKNRKLNKNLMNNLTDDDSVEETDCQSGTKLEDCDNDKQEQNTFQDKNEILGYDNEEEHTDQEDDEHNHDVDFNDQSKTLWRGFQFDSFNSKILTSSTMLEDKVVISPPGYAPFSLCPISPNGYNVQTLLHNLQKIASKDLVSENSSSFVNQKIWSRWMTDVVPKVIEAERRWHNLSGVPYDSSYLESLQCSTFFDLVSRYVDIIMSEQSYLNSGPLRAIISLHAVNHIIKTRYQQAKNNRILKELVEQHHAEVASALLASQKKNQIKHNSQTNLEPTSSFDPSGDDRFRDQGFNRPKVVIVTPTRQTAKDIIEVILDLLPGAKQVRHRKRFEREFSVEGCDSPEERLKESLGETLMLKSKPIDFIELFRGNASDQFRIGIRIHTSSVTLYAPFYQSDIIISSPLGLRLIVGTEGVARREFDFLSSIEILIIDRADVLKMQNWEHLRSLLDVMNRLPTQMRPDCDIRRLRETYVDGFARQFRQTILLSYGRRPEISSFYSRSSSSTSPLCCNFRGWVKLSHTSSGEPVTEGSLRVAKQLFLYLPCQSILELTKTLSSFMTHQFPPSFLSIDDNESILLVVPSYVEYLSVRRILKKSSLAAQDPRNLTHFLSCHEYTSNSNLTKSRHAFLGGQTKLLITTERFLFYRRYLLKGASHVLFLSPPEYPEIYTECLSALRNPSTAVSCVVYTKFHAPSIERLVGSTKLKTLLNDNGSVTSKLFVLG